jgi:hypothetical protein
MPPGEWLTIKDFAQQMTKAIGPRIHPQYYKIYSEIQLNLYMSTNTIRVSIIHIYNHTSHNSLLSYTIPTIELLSIIVEIIFDQSPVIDMRKI